MRHITPLAAAIALLLTACGTREKDYDATGTFEATEVTVYARQTGQLLLMEAQEGAQLNEGQLLALIDTTQLWLRLRQLEATREAYIRQQPNAEKQLAALREQTTKARQEQQRYSQLVADGAAPRKLLDDAESQLRVLQRQMDALSSTLHTQTATLQAQQAATEAQIAQVREQMAQCHVAAPITGTVLEKYVEPSELVVAGKPLVKMADTRQMVLRAYVTSSQLSHVKVGQQVKVFVNYGGGERHEHTGRVSWISAQSEFTPKGIVTDDERADLVFAIKVNVPNDGSIAMGMYGEVAGI